jgi:hypothetical protein
MYNTSLDTLKQMGDVVKSLYEKVGDTTSENGQVALADHFRRPEWRRFDVGVKRREIVYHALWRLHIPSTAGLPCLRAAQRRLATAVDMTPLAVRLIKYFIGTIGTASLLTRTSRHPVIVTCFAFIPGIRVISLC